MTVYESLREASGDGRREIAARLISDMKISHGTANQHYYGFCRAVARDLGVREATGARLPRQEFSAYDSAGLVIDTRRVAGFLSAIERAPRADTVIDAGTGSSAILAVGAAVLHPDSEIIAYEVNEPAARCAAEVVRLLGFSDRIKVEAADVLKVDLPPANLGITETFASGLTTEKGTFIAAALGRTSREILPAYAQLYATDEPITFDPEAVWQQTTLVNLAAGHQTITGTLASTRRGRRHVGVQAEFLDARQKIVVGDGVKGLTDCIRLGSVDAPRVDALIHFSYPAGGNLQKTPAQLEVS